MALSDRERKFIIFGGGGFALLIVIFVLIPAIFSGDSGDGASSVGGGKDDLEMIMGLYKDFANIHEDYKQIESKIRGNKNFSLLTELENLAEKAEIKANIESMESKPKPKNDFFKEESVDVRLVKIKLSDLVTFLYAIEYSPHILRVKKLNIEVRYDDINLMNSHVEVSTFKPLD